MAITQDGVELVVSISEKAAEKIQYFAAKEGIKGNVGVRVAVKGGGCSGLSYTLGFDSEVKEKDKVFEIEGIKVVDCLYFFSLSR